MRWLLILAVSVLRISQLSLVIAARPGISGLNSMRWTHVRYLLRETDFDPESLVAGKIFGGFPARINRYECMVSLRKPSSNQHYCGGVLISPDIVLTAGHCMDSGYFLNPEVESDPAFKGGFSQPNPVAHIGGSRVDQEDLDAEVIPACSTTVHSKWEGKFLKGNDIAIIKLQYPSKKIPCPLYQGRPFSSGQKLAALGWGRSENSIYSPTLQKAHNLIFENSTECNHPEKWKGYIGSGMMCADGPNGEDTCIGDSGGPLLMEGSKKGEDQVVGITSFGHVQGCGIPGLPGVYSEISFHREWIKTRGYGVSRIYPVPFCGNPTPNTGNLVDDITASIANNNMPEAVSAIARSFKADDLDAIEMAVQNVSRVGLAENAIKALVAAAKEEAIDGDAAVKALAGPIMSLPPANATIYSGYFKVDLEDSLYKDLKAGNVESAYSGIATAFEAARPQDVLKAVAAATHDGGSQAIGKCLNYAVGKGISSTDLAVVLAPICVGKGEECCRQLIGLGSSHSWDVIEHSQSGGIESTPETETIDETSGTRNELDP